MLFASLFHASTGFSINKLAFFSTMKIYHGKKKIKVLCFRLLMFQVMFYTLDRDESVPSVTKHEFLVYRDLHCMISARTLSNMAENPFFDRSYQLTEDKRAPCKCTMIHGVISSSATQSRPLYFRELRGLVEESAVHIIIGSQG